MTPKNSPPLVGIAGAGQVGRALARHFLNAGCEVILANSRGPESLAAAVVELGGSGDERVSAGTMQEALAADIVVLSVTWQNLDAVLKDAPKWNGRIVVDVTNPIINPGFKIAELGGRASSEVVADKVPDARLVKAGNTFAAALLAQGPLLEGGRRVLFLCGDDAEARKTVGDLMDAAGFAVVDLGTLASGAKLMQFPGGPLPGLDLVRPG
jgi:predicted dinucleotide-binding enzyme